MMPDALSQYDDELEPEPVVIEIEGTKESSSWDEASCVICSDKCHTFKPSDSNGLAKSKGQVSAEQLLTLMDTALFEDPPENVILCGACSFDVGKLQGIHDQLTRIQQIFLDLQKEIASKIVESSDKNEDDVRISLLKRWRDAERESVGTSNNDSNESDQFRLDDLQSPKDRSPAIEGLDEVELEVEEDHHEVKFHMDPSLYQVVEESGDKMQDGDDENMQDVDDHSVEIDPPNLIPAIGNSGFDDQPLDDEEMTPVIISTRSLQKPIFSTNGTVFTSDIDSPHPPDLLIELDSNEQASHSDSTESSKTNGRVARTTPYRSRRLRARPTNGLGKDKTPIFSCILCTDTFRCHKTLKEHYGREHMAKPYGCLICNQMFESSAPAMSHATSVHPEQAAGKIISKITFTKILQV